MPRDHESEAETRKARIDPRLTAAGWDAEPSDGGAGVRRLSELLTIAGPADYALQDGDTIRAVVEAKKVTIGPQGVLTQAERYSRGIHQEPAYQGEFGVPFLYSSNGPIIWFHDVRHPLNRSRKVAAFHTPPALAEMMTRDFDAEFAKLDELSHSPILRPYQIGANAAIEQAMRERKRTLLVTMATGTGKTLAMVNEVYRVMKSGVARRV
ncbi:MAG TPA: DEAD/DEAH box helicase family protein, partial [Candidatus Dormibacteraeota bacterium]|nr:DEAD/DEAH box helicase family protein [Candidatus Dormibacteraeota bacterium]